MYGCDADLLSKCYLEQQEGAFEHLGKYSTVHSGFLDSHRSKGLEIYVAERSVVSVGQKGQKLSKGMSRGLR